MKAEIICATAIAATMAAVVLGDATVRAVASDGVNVTETRVDAQGNIMGQSQTLAYVPQKYKPTDDESAEVRATIIEALESAKRQEAEREDDAVIVREVYGEGTNSSFITRRELTATQKRFLALGHRYTQLAIAYWRLEARVRELESELGKGVTIGRGLNFDKEEK